jgi:hypothetical protein
VPSSSEMPSPVAPHVPTAAADLLRRRAQTLRALASTVQHLRVLTLHLAAGPDTWIGPSAQRCADELRTTRGALLTCADELVSAARWLERQADELDAYAAVVAAIGLV